MESKSASTKKPTPSKLIAARTESSDAAPTPEPAPMQQATVAITPAATPQPAPAVETPGVAVASSPPQSTGDKRQKSPTISSSEPLFYRDKPTFAIDVGSTSIKILQLGNNKGKKMVTAYGLAPFEVGAVKDGEIVQTESIAKTIKTILSGPELRGTITTRRVTCAVPSRRCFIRNMTIPNIAIKDLTSAVQLELEQYLPIPAKDLYLDYDIVQQTKDETELLVVAVPKKTVDAYLEVARLLGLEVVNLEPTITANARLFARLEDSHAPTILIDFGATSSDIMVYDQVLLTATSVIGGGDTFTSVLAEKLATAPKEAHFIKTKFGLNKSLTQQDTAKALEPVLSQLVQEIRRIQRYYAEHVSGTRKLEQVVIMGGGANMPGLSDYLTDNLRIPTRLFAPWQKLDFAHNTSGGIAEMYQYTTAAGLAMLEPKELFR
ncbi:MAG TPA: type IV pilus assembly protein PilM [Candidatus Saccharimonadales bacterium]|nr:type IV pilus assembly protein PilM [Candidatus Saccharimonadales bacterium]